MDIVGIIESILMHNPIRLETMRSSSFVEDQCLPHSYPLTVAVYHLVPTRCLPKPGHRSSVGPRPRGVLLVLVAKEVPLVLWCASYLASLCK